MAKTKFVTPVTYNPSKDVRYERNIGESKTIIGETYTIQELFARLSNGVDPSIQKEPYFEDTEDFDLPDLSRINRMDIFDRAELYEEVQNKAALALQAAKEAVKELEDKEKQAASERSVETQSAPTKDEVQPAPKAASTS